MDCVSDIVFLYIVFVDLYLIYSCLVAGNLFSCLTPCYISIDESMIWYGLIMWHAKMHVIKAFIEKQSLVDEDQSIAFI